MGKEQDLLEASRSGQIQIIEKILNARIKKSGPLNLTRLVLCVCVHECGVSK